jgi:hypothetical protein
MSIEIIRKFVDQHINPIINNNSSKTYNSLQLFKINLLNTLINDFNTEYNKYNNLYNPINESNNLINNDDLFAPLEYGYYSNNNKKLIFHDTEINDFDSDNVNLSDDESFDNINVSSDDTELDESDSDSYIWSTNVSNSQNNTDTLVIESSKENENSSETSESDDNSSDSDSDIDTENIDLYEKQNFDSINNKDSTLYESIKDRKFTSIYETNDIKLTLCDHNDENSFFSLDI